MTATPELSVIVCSHNGASKLPLPLRTLRDQTLSAERYEVIVVDDGSKDRTAEVATEAGVRLVRLEPNAGLAAARNAGVSAARGNVVALTDDDCEVAREWAEIVLAAFSDPDVDGVGGRVVPESTDNFVRRFLAANNPLTPLKAELLTSNSRAFRLRLYLERTVHGDAEPPHQLYSVVGANMAFRRELILALDGYDEAFRFGGEEEDLCVRAHGRPGGARLDYEHEAVVVHWFDGRISDSIRRSRAYGRGNARRVLKHPHTRPIVYPTPIGLVTLMAATGLARRPWLLLGALLLPLVTYPRWFSFIKDYDSIEPVSYPYINLAQETAVMVGEVEGWRTGYEPVPSRHIVRRAKG